MNRHNHPRRRFTTVLVAGSTLSAGAAALAACGREAPAVAVDRMTASTPDSTPVLEWVAFQHANAALADAERRMVAEEDEAESHALQKAATALDRLAEAAEDGDRSRLEASATELDALARRLPADVTVHRAVMGEVLSRALVALARTHLERAERSAAAGDRVAAGRHLITAANDVDEGFRVAAVEMPAPGRAGLADARRTAEAWIDGDPAASERVEAARLEVGQEAERLAGALEARRR